VLGHIDLANYYKILFAMAQHYNYSIADIENLLPFERDIFVDMLIEFIQKQKEKATK
jgi:hypothetical protein